MKADFNYRQGLSLVEVVMASALILLIVVSLLGVHTLYIRAALRGGSTVKAVLLAEEGIEAAKFLRDASWQANIEPLAEGAEYGLALAGGLWQASTTALYVGEFRRTIVLSDVYRNESGDIVSAGGTFDPDTKLITSSVSWPSAGATTTRSVSTYLTNLHDN